MHTDRDRNDDYYSKKPKKPDQTYYQEHQKQQQNPGSKSEKARYERPYDNRQSRLGSEPRAGNNNFSNQDPKLSYANAERSRDTRSSEPGSGPGSHYEHRNKPPSGPIRLNNAAFQTRIHHNIDHLPPRLKKKYLLEQGLPEDYVEKPMEQSYSNTLPTGRGRNNRYDQQGYHHQNYQNTYQPKYSQGSKMNHEPNYHHRSLTPPTTQNIRPQLQSQQQQKPPPQRYDWKPNDIQRLDDSSPSKPFQEDTDFNWSEEVMNSQSLPHEVNSAPNVHNKYEDNNTRHRRNRRRNRR